MNAEYLLDAVGLLDDDLIQEAEHYTVRRREFGYQAWMGLAACLAVVVVLGYGLTHIRMGSSNTASPSQGAPGASTSGGGHLPLHPDGNGSYGGSNDLNSGSPASSEPPAITEEPTPGDSPNSGSEWDFCAAIMVDGVVYWSTDTPVPGEVDESAIRTVTSYTDGQPEEDGQTNFDRGLTTRYAMTDMGLVVLINQEWILFDPVPPWEK